MEKRLFFSFGDLVFKDLVFDSDCERLENLLKDINFLDNNSSENAINRVLRETGIKYKTYNFRNDSGINKKVKEGLKSLKRMMDSKDDYNRILYNINSILFEFNECQKINRYYTLYMYEEDIGNKNDYKDKMLRKISKLDKSYVKVIEEVRENEILTIKEGKTNLVEFNSVKLNQELRELKKKLSFISDSKTDKLLPELDKLLEINIRNDSNEFFSIFNVIKNYSLPSDTELEILKKELTEKIVDVSKISVRPFDFIREENIVRIERKILEKESIRYLLIHENNKKQEFEQAIESYIENQKSISKTLYYAEQLKQYQAFKSRVS